MDALFAQINKGGGAGGPGGGDAAVALGMMCFYGLFFVAIIAIEVMFLLSMSRCLKAVSPRNRKMEPGQVWLCFIPLFGTVWFILMILRIAESLELEYEDRDLRSDGDFGKTMGIISFVSALVCGCISPIFIIIYWVKINGYTRTLKESPGSGRDDYDDDDRDPPRRRRSRDDDDDDYEDRPTRGSR